MAAVWDDREVMLWLLIYIAIKHPQYIIYLLGDVLLGLVISTICVRILLHLACQCASVTQCGNTDGLTLPL